MEIHLGLGTASAVAKKVKDIWRVEMTVSMRSMKEKTERASGQTERIVDEHFANGKGHAKIKLGDGRTRQNLSTAWREIQNCRWLENFGNDAALYCCDVGEAESVKCLKLVEGSQKVIWRALRRKI